MYGPDLPESLIPRIGNSQPSVALFFDTMVNADDWSDKSSVLETGDGDEDDGDAFKDG